MPIVTEIFVPIRIQFGMENIEGEEDETQQPTKRWHWMVGQQLLDSGN